MGNTRNMCKLHDQQRVMTTLHEPAGQSPAGQVCGVHRLCRKVTDIVCTHLLVSYLLASQTRTLICWFHNVQLEIQSISFKASRIMHKCETKTRVWGILFLCSVSTCWCFFSPAGFSIAHDACALACNVSGNGPAGFLPAGFLL